MGTGKNDGIGLWLVRFVIVTFKPEIEKPNFTLISEGIQVRTLAVVRPKDSEPAVLLEARTELKKWPVRTPDGTVLVPKDARNKLEEWLEYSANLMAVGDTTSRQLSSPSISAAFVGKTTEATEWLDKSVGYKSQENKAINSGGAVRVTVKPEVFTQLGDRLDGISLLAEAISQNTALGKFRDLIRLFERAYRTPAGKLQPLLMRFLSTTYGYTEAEITHWLEIRDRATHADVKPDHKLAYEKDVYRLIGRVQQAAYDVLMNKATWQTNDTHRIERWTPDFGSTSTRGGLFITKGRGATVTVTILDGFGSYPLHLGGGIEAILSISAEDSYWTKRIEQDIHAAGTFTVLPNSDDKPIRQPHGNEKEK